MHTPPVTAFPALPVEFDYSWPRAEDMNPEACPASQRSGPIVSLEPQWSTCSFVDWAQQWPSSTHDLLWSECGVTSSSCVLRMVWGRQTQRTDTSVQGVSMVKRGSGVSGNRWAPPATEFSDTRTLPAQQVERLEATGHSQDTAATPWGLLRENMTPSYRLASRTTELLWRKGGQRSWELSVSFRNLGCQS